MPTVTPNMMDAAYESILETGRKLNDLRAMMVLMKLAAVTNDGRSPEDKVNLDWWGIMTIANRLMEEIPESLDEAERCLRTLSVKQKIQEA